MCLEFCQHVLVVLEVLACTFTGAEPKFASKFMLSHGTTDDLQNLSNVTGMESWMIQCLIDLTILRHWKDVELSKGSLSVIELVKKAVPLERDLRDRRQENLERIKSQPLQEKVIFSNVFASAASVFLHATISEPYPQIPEIQQAVSDTTDALRLLPHPDLLRRLAWPVCIAACLADSSNQDFFKELSRRVTEAYGKDENISRGLAVARECWKMRARTGQDDQPCDWNDAMKSLDTMLLLY